MKPPRKMRVKELREALEGRGLETSGLKAVLLVRLKDAIKADADVPAEPVSADEPAAAAGAAAEAEASKTAEA